MSGLTNIEPIDQAHYYEMLDFVIQKGMNIITLGPSGTGKTVIPMQVCKKRKLKYVLVNLSVLERTDLLGIPYADENNRTVYAPPKFLPMGADEDTVIIFDEMDKVSEDLQAPLLELLQFQSVNGQKLNIKAIVATGNLPDEGAFSHLLNKALTNRALVFELVPSPQLFRKHAVKSGYDSMIVQFITVHEEFWLKPDPSETAYATPCPRMWQEASDALKNLPEDASVDMKYRIIAGYVGHEAAMKFRIWLEYYRDLDGPIMDLFERGIHPEELDIDKKLILATAVVHKLCRTATTVKSGTDVLSPKQMKQRAANVFGWLKGLEGDIMYGAISVAKHNIDLLFEKYNLSEVEEFEEVLAYVDSVAA